MTVSINPQDKLPTVTAERCENVHIYYYDPRALGSIYTVKCSNVYVHLQPPYPSEMPLQLPAPDESNDQFVSTYKPQGKHMATVKVLRGIKCFCLICFFVKAKFNLQLLEGGGYVTTEEELKKAQLREKHSKLFSFFPF